MTPTEHDDSDDTVEMDSPPFAAKPPQPPAEDRGPLGTQPLLPLPADFYEWCREHGGAN